MADQRRKPIVDPRAAEKRRSLYMKIGAALVLVLIAVGVGVVNFFFIVWRFYFIVTCMVIHHK